jgi:hypothetical protein
VPVSEGRPPDFLDALRALCDALQALLLHGPGLDLQHIIATVREFADALEDPGRIAALDRLLKRTGLRS